MSIQRKDKNGNVVRVAGGVVQRWNDRIFNTTHSIENGADYYDIEPLAKKYITGLTNFTEFQLYFDTVNTTPNCFIRFNGVALELTRSDGGSIGIGFVNKRLSLYTRDTTDGKMWLDSLLQPTSDTYKGNFTFVVQTWNETWYSGLVIAPGNTVISLDTKIIREWDGTGWDYYDTLTLGSESNGWYWMVEFFADYSLNSGRLIWNGASESWNIYTYAEGAYVLPQANNTTLGGVKAKTKTTETNEVAIDPATGKLYVSESTGSLDASEIIIDDEDSVFNGMDVQSSLEKLENDKETLSIDGGVF